MRGTLHNAMRQPRWLTWLVWASLALLPLLAYWQYRWLGAVSEAESKRMRDNLQASAAQFAEAFDLELTQIHRQLQPTRALNLNEAASGLSVNLAFPLQYQQWLKTTAHPGLVRGIYESELRADGSITLTTFDPQQEAFMPTAWTDALEPVRACVMRADKAAQFAAQRREEMRLPTFPGMATTVKFSLSSPLEDSLPGFVMPLEDASGLANVQRYRVVLLDLDYLEHKWLPALAQKHLLKQGDAEYAFAIFKRGERAMPLYDSNPTQKQSWAVSDLTQTLGKVKPQEPDHMFIKLPEGAALPGMAINKDPRRTASIRIESFTTGETTLRTEGKTTAVPQITASPAAAQAQAFIVAPRGSVTMSAGDPNDGTRATMINELLQNVLQNKPEGPWQLVIKHRAGSLDAAVAQVRHRNLAISFGVLALLGLSLALLAIASRRAQTLAHRQLEFVAGVSHELRTPLAVICSAAENLADGVVDNREQIKQYGTLIRDEGRRLGGMVEQVLEFAGAQSGKRTYDLRQVNAQAVIEDALAALQLPIVEQGFTVETQLPATLPMLQADQAALSRALQNLLTNAMKYSGENRWIGLRGELSGNELLLTVQDRGLGIPADELSHLGEAFYRGKEVVAAQIHGNGLGLSLVKHILQVHGGRLSIASKVGQGSAFTMHLPLAAASANEHSPLAAVEAE